MKSLPFAFSFLLDHFKWWRRGGVQCIGIMVVFFWGAPSLWPRLWFLRAQFCMFLIAYPSHFPKIGLRPLWLRLKACSALHAANPGWILSISWHDSWAQSQGSSWVIESKRTNSTTNCWPILIYKKSLCPEGLTLASKVSPVTFSTTSQSYPQLFAELQIQTQPNWGHC